VRIEVDDLSRPEVHALLAEHLANMHELSPTEYVFALDLGKMRAADITFWTIWDDERLVGCGALKELSPTHGEVKSMRIRVCARGLGAGRLVLKHIVAVARQRGYTRLSLETGTHAAFAPALSLYRSMGFEVSGPFGNYVQNEHSVFMRLQLG
jgi:putative acetyltransferase